MARTYQIKPASASLLRNRLLYINLKNRKGAGKKRSYHTGKQLHHTGEQSRHRGEQSSNLTTIPNEVLHQIVDLVGESLSP